MTMSPFWKGMTAGVIVGSTIAISVMPKKEAKCKCIKHKTGKILKSAGNVIENLQSFM